MLVGNLSSRSWKPLSIECINVRLQSCPSHVSRALRAFFLSILRRAVFVTRERNAWTYCASIPQDPCAKTTQTITSWTLTTEMQALIYNPTRLHHRHPSLALHNRTNQSLNLDSTGNEISRLLSLCRTIIVPNILALSRTQPQRARER